MYQESFYITEAVGNNAFSYGKRENKKLYVPSLRKIESFDEITLRRPVSGDRSQITFEDFDFDDVLQTCYGLKNLYSYNSLLNPLSFQEKGATKPMIYLVDNHNHVHYFWYIARHQGIIANGARVYHIDAHADMRDPGVYLSKSESRDMQKVFEYTNFTLNVGNFIVPAMREGLVSEVVQIRGEGDLKEYLITHPEFFSLQVKKVKNQQSSSLEKRGDSEESFVSQEVKQSIILDLDLDFFTPEMDYIDFKLAREVILDIASRADLITICTSPFFIDQERALRVLREIFI